LNEDTPGAARPIQEAAGMFRTGSSSRARVASICAFSVAAAVSSLSAQGAGQVPPPPRPPASAETDTSQVGNVGGRWELNWRLSDKLPENAGAPARGEPGEPPSGGGHKGGGGGMGGGMPGRGGMGGYGGHGGEGRGGERAAATAEQVRAFLQSQRTLVIVEHPDHVSITDETGQVQKLVTNGEKLKDERGGESFERRTRWDGRTLITEIALSDGVRITQTYQKVAEGLQLVITTKLENSKVSGPREFKRVYDQALQ
jgi:hypothetical protein